MASSSSTTPTATIGTFSTALWVNSAYCNQRPGGLQKAFGATNIAAAKGHWAQYGKNEKRDWIINQLLISTVY